jgi:hypothetical protein
MTARTRQRRYIRPTRPKAPVAPADAYARSRPSTTDGWNWQPGEIVLGPTPKLGSDVLARIRALYAPSKPDGGAE